ncbi:MAG: BON domain-containing protein [Acidiferrobacteraceae bacterium]
MARRAIRLRECCLLVAVLLGGCAPLVIGGAVGTGLVAHDSRSFTEIVDDQLIQLRARGAIAGNPALRRSTHIQVYSENGTVLLTGQAPTPELRDKALLLVRVIPHIKRIVNQIEIAPPSTLAQRTEDSWLTTEVKAHLVATRGVDPTRIRVITAHRVVYLMGLVPPSEGQAAAVAASEVPGVHRIVELFDFNR